MSIVKVVKEVMTKLFKNIHLLLVSGRSRKLGTGGGGGGGGGGGATWGRLRQNQVLAVCTERSTGKSPPLPYHYGSPGAPPPKSTPAGCC